MTSFLDGLQPKHINNLEYNFTGDLVEISLWKHVEVGIIKRKKGAVDFYPIFITCAKYEHRSLCSMAERSWCREERKECDTLKTHNILAKLLSD